MHHFRILYIDAYDSFANNVVALLTTKCDAKIVLIKHSDSRFWPHNIAAFEQYLAFFDAVVAGPGPGHPVIDNDIGLVKHLWTLSPQNVLPVLGICLGFQSLCAHFGGQVNRLKEPKHGLVRQLKHVDADIFLDAGDLNVTCYHSLCAVLKNQVLTPLAWDTDEYNGDVLMAVRHSTHPFWGVQYHPESICTNTAGANTISAWWKLAMTWNEHNRVTRISDPFCQQMARNLASDEATLAKVHYRHIIKEHSHAFPALKQRAVGCRSSAISSNLNFLKLCETLQMNQKQAVVLKSGTAPGQSINKDLARFSIIALPTANNLHIRYSVERQSVLLSLGHKPVIIETKVVNLWNYIKSFVEMLTFHGGHEDSPFWGGFMGYISYEAGLATIPIENITSMSAGLKNAFQRPDVHLLFVEKSIVIDHVNNIAHAQDLRQDLAWCDDMLDLCNIMFHPTKEPASQTKSIPVSSKSLLDYTKKIGLCDKFIRAGDSYELTLTNTTTIHVPHTQSGWNLFCKLQTTNPAPFSAYIRLPTENDAVTIVSSSPERFLSWSRNGTCQFRPIKGTVKKSADITFEDAKRLLGSSKECAENLMIADLIRHDLHGVTGIAVTVPKLMQVEEYATVYQLVSVIQGSGLERQHTGIDVLAASLPPGSMTGAPKKRSCQLLQGIENKARGIYSGLLGYFDVGGGGDFSVVIRTACKWDANNIHDGQKEWQQWTIGAGGAITAQSIEYVEYLEMLAKLNSVLGAFDVELVMDGERKQMVNNEIWCDKSPF